MKNLPIKIFNNSHHRLPEYATELSAGMDVKADIDSPITLYPGDRQLIPTGLYMEIPEGYELQIRSRSGLSLKQGLIVLNSPATIDADYRGEIGVILMNTSKDTVIVNPGDRIAQFVVAKYEKVEWVSVRKEDLSSTVRGERGFGHSDIKS